MATANITNDIRFKSVFTINDTTKEITFTDLTDYLSLGIAYADVEGFLRITGPTGLLHDNAAFAIPPTFAAPDIDRNVTDTIGSIALPTSGGVVLQGSYLFEYRVVVAGSGVLYYEMTKTHSFTYDLPVIDISVVTSCQTSSGVSTDITDYKITYNGALVNYATITRDHRVRFPYGSGATSPVTGTAATLNFGGGPTPDFLWTGFYDVLLTSILSYNIELWDPLGAMVPNPVWFILDLTLYGAKEDHEVTCASCMCNFYACLSAIKAKYEAERTYTGTSKEAERLMRLMVSLLGAIALYNTAERCGEDPSVWCTQIETILLSENCSCDYSADSASVEVLPWSALVGVVVGAGSVWYNGAGAPGGGLGVNGDYYLDITPPPGAGAYNIYYKSGGVWAVIGNILGASPTAYNPVIYYNTTDVSTPAGTGETDLMTYTVAGGKLAKDGEEIQVDALLRLATNSNGKTIKVYWDGAIVFTYFTTSLPTALNQHVRINTIIRRDGAATQAITTTLQREGYQSAPNQDIQGATLANPIVVKITGQNSVASAADIRILYMTVKYISKV